MAGFEGSSSLCALPRAYTMKRVGKWRAMQRHDPRLATTNSVQLRFRYDASVLSGSRVVPPKHSATLVFEL